MVPIGSWARSMMKDAEKRNRIAEKSLGVILERMIVVCYQSKINETAFFKFSVLMAHQRLKHIENV